MVTAEDPSLRFFSTMHVKDHVFGNVFGETFSDSFRQKTLTASILSGHLAVIFLPEVFASLLSFFTDTVA